MRTAEWLVAVGLVVMVGVMAPLALSAADATSPAPGGQEASEAEPLGSGAGPPATQAEATAEVFPGWLPPGGVYGRQKWVPGSYGVDVFLPRGAEVRAPLAGLVVAPAEVVYPQPPPIPAVALRSDDGLSFFLGHVRPLVSPGSRVDAGDPLGVVDDPVLDQVTVPGPGPSGWQHVDLNVSRGGMFTWYGGDIPASPWLQATGYEGTLVEQTPGPPGLR